MKKSNHENLKIRSGNFSSHNKLTSFLYELMRDHVLPGDIEKIMNSCSQQECHYTNGWLAQYAEDIALRLEGKI